MSDFLARIEKLLPNVLGVHRNCLEKEEVCTHSSNLTDLKNSTVKRRATNRIRNYNLVSKSLSDVPVKSNILTSINYIEGGLHLFNDLLAK